LEKPGVGFLLILAIQVLGVLDFRVLQENYKRGKSPAFMPLFFPLLIFEMRRRSAAILPREPCRVS
jgi:hypothetical protein